MAWYQALPWVSSDPTEPITARTLATGFDVTGGVIPKTLIVDVDATVSSLVSGGHTQGTDTALGTLGTKNPPIDADKLPYRDSTATDALVTSTWTQVKAFLKTYFDTLYNLYVHPTTNGNIHLPATGGSTQLVQYSSAGTGKWITVSSDVSIADNGAATVASTHSGSAHHAAVTVSEPLVLSTQALSFRGTAKYYSSYANFAAACDATGYLIIDSNCTATTDNFAAVVEVQNGAVITVPNGVTLTINLPFFAGLHQVFTCTGSGKVVFGVGAVKEVLPEWWGIDGTADEVQINAAIASLATDAFTVGKVKLAPKSYTISAAIAWARDRVVLSGVRGSTWIKSANTTINLIEVGDGGANYYNNHIEDIVLQKTAVSSAGAGIYMNLVFQCSIKGVFVYGYDNAGTPNKAMKHGISLYNVGEITIDEMTKIFYCVSNGLEITGNNNSYDVYFKGWAWYNGGYGVVTGVTAQGIYIDGANIFDNDSGNVRFVGTAGDPNDNMIITNSVIDTAGLSASAASHGIYADYCTNVVIRNNWIGANCAYGIGIGGNVNRGLISGNYVINSQQHGIVSSGTGIKIDGNVVTQSGEGAAADTYYGIFVGGDTAGHGSDSSITNNSVYQYELSGEHAGDLLDGIHVHGSPDNVFVGMNHVYDIADTVTTHYGINIADGATNTKYGGNVTPGLSNYWGTATSFNPVQTKVLTSTLDAQGEEILAHGITDGYKNIVSCSAFYKGAYSEARPLTISYLDGSDISITGGGSAVNYRVFVEYVLESPTW
jgi:hypothetical protein